MGKKKEKKTEVPVADMSAERALFPDEIYIAMDESTDDNGKPFALAGYTIEEAFGDETERMIGVYKLVKTVTAKKFIKVS